MRSGGGIGGCGLVVVGVCKEERGVVIWIEKSDVGLGRLGSGSGSGFGSC